jgi:hypothetical protein
MKKIKEFMYVFFFCVPFAIIIYTGCVIGILIFNLIKFMETKKINDIEVKDFVYLSPPKETLEEAATIYAHKSFIWPLNKQGEKQSIPPGQIVPPGYAKHQKIATKHFTAGYKSAQENSNINALEFEIVALKSLIQDMDATIKSKYSEEEVMEMFHNLSMHLPLHYEFLVKEQFKKK